MKNENKKKCWYLPIINFAVHAFVGAAIFMIVGTPAVVLSCLVHYLGGFGVDSFLISTLTFLEHSIVLIDVFAVLVYLVVSTYREIKEMLDDDE